MGLINRIKENNAKRQQEKQIEVQKEKERLISLSEKELDSIVIKILENYDELKNITEINEILTDIIEDYKFIMENGE